ncbi:MAG: sugar phosphate isomerase, partial [Lentisphaeria bacterium]|nr:sugar phosphate isomerase [Lentisphaeria bacterium]
MQNEKQFHLGFLPTEQSSPLTANLDKEFASSTCRGVRNLQLVDRNVLEMAEKIFSTPQFERLRNTALATVKAGNRIIFSGCGATGRLSILLESMWRSACLRDRQLSKYADQAASIMTGGDYALVKSVEFFEDYQSFGRRQAADLDINSGDMLIAITEGGETSSVLGTLFESLDRGASCFLLFNNPADILAEHLERSRKAICDPRVCVLDLSCGPMAIAGSTRMQATTSEQLVAGAAVEYVLHELAGKPQLDYAVEFKALLDQLESEENVAAIADYIDFETAIYRKKGYITYFSDEYLLDIFTDTTERSPTFMLPPFRKCGDTASPRPWAFVKHPLLSTEELWQQRLNRQPRCLEWSVGDYMSLGAPESVQTAPPLINAEELYKFQVGKENIADRIVSGSDAAVLFSLGKDKRSFSDAFDEAAQKFSRSCRLAIGSGPADHLISCTFPDGTLKLMEHLAAKLVLNTISTGTMTCLGR